MINNTEWMVYDDVIIDTFKNIKLNHKKSISKSRSRRRKKHVEEIIKRRKVYKETHTIIINSNGTRTSYR